MPSGYESISPRWARALLYVVGGFYLVAAVGWGGYGIYRGVFPGQTLLPVVLIGVPGAIIGYGAHRLRDADVVPRFYSNITLWTLGAIGFMVALLTAYELQPGVAIDDPLESGLILTALSSLAGFAAGMYNSHATSRAHELERARYLLHQTERIADVGGWEIDPATMEVFWTEHLFELFGMSSDEPPQVDEALDVYLEEDRPIIERAIEQGLEERESFDVEARYKNGAGEVCWLQVQGGPEFEDGELVSLRGSAQDITERKVRESELERYETAVETVWDGVTMLDGDFRFVMVNHAFCEMSGYERESILGESATRIMDEDTYEAAGELYQRVANGQLEVATLEYDLQTADGGTIPVEARFGPSTFEDGSVGGTGVIRDISDRHERDRRLRQRARQQQAVSDLGQLALESDDLDELMQEVANRVAEELEADYCEVLDLQEGGESLLLRHGTGWDAGYIGETTVSATEAGSQAAYTLERDEPVVVEDLEHETRFDGPDLLHDHDAKSGITTIIGPVGDPWGILGAHTTEQQAFTREDVNFVQSVANVLAEAIERQQYEEQLERVIRDLEESNERLEQFAYAASHDLQEPLRMVSSYLQLIERRYSDELDEDGEEFLEFAVDGADRMREMIDGLLQYSRVETEGEELEPVDLNALLEDVLRDLDVQISETDATIQAEELPTVYADERQLGQVLQNLLKNAIVYSGDAPPFIRVEATRDGASYTISVTDEGIGIEPAEQDRIFDIFQRGDASADRSGSGIGLALAERIIERHGGEIWVDSVVGEGSTFSFTIPADSPYDE